jgi:multicomponent Na+:H+ antiporter subunit E
MYLLIILIVFWVVLSGYFSLLPLLPGLLSLLVILWLFSRAKKSSGYIHIFSFRFFTFLPYILYIIKEIYKSNLAVAKAILFSRLSPQVIYVANDFIENSAINTFANSITLTPGSITLKVNEDFIIIHCINLDVSTDIQNNDMKHKVDKLQHKQAKD